MKRCHFLFWKLACGYQIGGSKIVGVEFGDEVDHALMGIAFFVPTDDFWFERAYEVVTVDVIKCTFWFLWIVEFGCETLMKAFELANEFSAFLFESGDLLVYDGVVGVSVVEELSYCNQKYG